MTRAGRIKWGNHRGHELGGGLSAPHHLPGPCYVPSVRFPASPSPKPGPALLAIIVDCGGYDYADVDWLPPDAGFIFTHADKAIGRW